MALGRDHVTVVDGIVTKVHGGSDGAVRASHAAVAMEAARSAGLRVPRVLDVAGAVLRVEEVVGAVSGAARLADRPEEVLAAVGSTARRLAGATPPPRLPVAEPGGVWVHGDLCPVNLLLVDDDVAVVDWEDSRVDDPLVDLVWSEWLVRTHHAAAVDQLHRLYEAYGAAVPPVGARRAAARRVLLRQRERAAAAERRTWDGHLAALPDLDLAIRPR